jgi:hypothetical protein
MVPGTEKASTSQQPVECSHMLHILWSVPSLCKERTEKVYLIIWYICYPQHCSANGFGGFRVGVIEDYSFLMMGRCVFLDVSKVAVTFIFKVYWPIKKNLRISTTLHGVTSVCLCLCFEVTHSYRALGIVITLEDCITLSFICSHCYLLHVSICVRPSSGNPIVFCAGNYRPM